LVASATACAAGDNPTAGVEQQTDDTTEQQQPSDEVCVPGHQTTCPCPSGDEGIQVCNSDGSGFDSCECAPGDLGPDDPVDTDPCGDGFCGAGEDCHTCTADCGTCEPCNIAPSCDNSTVPPANMPHWSQFDVPKMDYLDAVALQQRLVDAVAEAGPEMRVLVAALDNAPSLDEHPLVTSLREVFDGHPAAADALRRQLNAAGMSTPAAYRAQHPEHRLAAEQDIQAYDVEYPGGSMECGAPLLRVGVSKIKVHEEDDDIANDIVYCVVQAETMTAAEIRVTPKTPNLDEGDEYSFALEAGVFWGQQGVVTPAGHMLITYDCIEADTTAGYQALVDSIGQAAGQIGNVVEGENGWIFDTTAAIAPIVSTGLALDSDDHLFNAQQTIPLDQQLELTNGAFWTVRRAGTHFFSDWDWELTINAWGCAEYGQL